MMCRFWTSWSSKARLVVSSGQRYRHGRARIVDKDPLARCLANQGNLEAAKACFHAMVAQGLKPNQSSLARLVYLCHRRRDREGFDSVMAFIDSCEEELEEGLGTAVIPGLVEGGQTARAREIHNGMRERGVKVRPGAINALLEGGLQERDVSWCVDLFHQLTDMNQPPNSTTSKRSLQVAGELGVRGRPLAHAVMEMYQREVMEEDMARELVDWLKLQPEQCRVSEVSVDHRGLCECCGAHLQDSSLSPGHHRQLLQCAEQQLAAEANSFLNNQPELSEVQLFRNIVQRPTRFAAVLDGLNIAHLYTGRPLVKQVLQVATAVRDRLQGPVLIISRKHLTQHFHPRSSTPLDITRRFQPRGLEFFFTKNRVADDVFFIYGTLASGRGTYFVSNDKLGDHMAHSVPRELLSTFRQWQASRQVMLDAAPPALKKMGVLQPTLKFPLPYRQSLQWTDNWRSFHIPFTRDSNVQWICATSSTTDSINSA